LLGLGLPMPQLCYNLEELRDAGFVVHCLYNQETAEHPQLYFSHSLATGDAVDRARKVATALDKMNLKRS